jgi:hypothetical protein
MSRLLGHSNRLVRAWVRYYTRDMPPDVRDARRAELESDLWEHAATSGSARVAAVSVLDRFVRGMPADITWRRDVRRDHPLYRHDTPHHDHDGGTMTLIAERVVAGLAILLGAFYLSLAAQGFFGQMGGSYAGQAVYGAICLIGGALIFGGLATSRRLVPLGGLALALGALSMVFMLYWMWFIVVIVVTPVVWLGVQRARRAAGSSGMRPA